MRNIYKVVNVTQAKTKNENIVYHILLNDGVLIKYVDPESSWPNGKQKGHAIQKVSDFFYKNNNSLFSLIGNYIDIEIHDTEWGKKFYLIYSLDIIGDFYEALKNANNMSFIVNFDIYKFLEKLGYKKNEDASITLRNNYSNYNVNIRNICYVNDEYMEFEFSNYDKWINKYGKLEYPHSLRHHCSNNVVYISVENFLENLKNKAIKENGRCFKAEDYTYYVLSMLKYTINIDNSITLKGELSTYNINKNNICYPNSNLDNIFTFENIKLIFDEFYKNKQHSNPDVIDSYSLGEYYISYQYTNTHKRTGKSLSSGSRHEKRIGDPLDIAHINFLLSKKH